MAIRAMNAAARRGNFRQKAGGPATTEPDVEKLRIVPAFLCAIIL